MLVQTGSEPASELPDGAGDDAPDLEPRGSVPAGDGEVFPNQFLQGPAELTG